MQFQQDKRRLNVLYKDEGEEDGKKHLKTKRRQEKGRKLKIRKGGRARDSREETSSVTSAS